MICLTMTRNDMKHYQLIVSVTLITVSLSPLFSGANGNYEEKISEIKRAYTIRDYPTSYKLSVQALESPRLSADQKGQLYYYIALSQRYQGEYAQAFRSFEKAINTYDSDDKKAQVLLNLGALMSLLSQHDEAVSIYTRSIKLSDSWAYLGYYNRALAHKANGDLPEAVKDLYASLQSCEDHGYDRAVARIYNQMGLIELGTGNLVEARDYFFKAINTDIDTAFSGVAWHNIAQADLERGDTLQAISSFEKAIPLHRSTDQLLVTFYDLCELYINMEKSPGGQGGTAEYYYHKADSVYHSGATLNETSLRLFFRGMDLGLATHQQLESEFTRYTEERNQTMEAYQAYTGALLLQQIAIQQSLLLERIMKWTLAGLFILAAVLTWWWWYRKRMSIQKDLMSINNQFNDV